MVHKIPNSQNPMLFPILHYVFSTAVVAYFSKMLFMYLKNGFKINGILHRTGQRSLPQTLSKSFLLLASEKQISRPTYE